MTDILIAVLAAALTAADGMITGLGRQLTQADNDTRQLVRTIVRLLP